jgi:hypothetical protein
MPQTAGKDTVCFGQSSPPPAEKPDADALIAKIARAAVDWWVDTMRNTGVVSDELLSAEPYINLLAKKKLPDEAQIKRIAEAMETVIRERIMADPDDYQIRLVCDCHPVSDLQDVLDRAGFEKDERTFDLPFKTGLEIRSGTITATTLKTGPQEVLKLSDEENAIVAESGSFKHQVQEAIHHILDAITGHHPEPPKSPEAPEKPPEDTSEGTKE